MPISVSDSNVLYEFEYVGRWPERWSSWANVRSGDGRWRGGVVHPDPACGSLQQALSVFVLVGMGQLHCVPEVPAGSAPLQPFVPAGFAPAVQLVQAQRSRLHGQCIVTEVRYSEI